MLEFPAEYASRSPVGPAWFGRAVQHNAAPLRRIERRLYLSYHAETAGFLAPHPPAKSRYRIVFFEVTVQSQKSIPMVLVPGFVLRWEPPSWRQEFLYHCGGGGGLRKSVVNHGWD